jgi:hypothetical protein
MNPTVVIVCLLSALCWAIVAFIVCVVRTV